jgi:hypothetical protein
MKKGPSIEHESIGRRRTIVEEEREGQKKEEKAVQPESVALGGPEEDSPGRRRSRQCKPRETRYPFTYSLVPKPEITRNLCMGIHGPERAFPFLWLISHVSACLPIVVRSLMHPTAFHLLHSPGRLFRSISFPIGGEVPCK